jgi:outer membrane protein assembly factor BamB
MRARRSLVPALLALVVAPVLAAAAFAATPSPAEARSAAAWTQFHYASTLSGYDPLEHTLNTGNVGGLTPIWHRVLGDSVLGTPLVAGNRVFALTTSGRLYALRPRDGRTLWSVQVGSQVVSTPAIWGRSIITPGYGAGASFVAAYNVASGTRRWRTAVPVDDYAQLTSPTIYGNTVYVSGGMTIYALSASTGRVIWKSQVTTSSDGLVSGPVAVSGYGEFVIAAGMDGRVYALDARTGAVRWSVLAGGGIYHGGPAIYSGIVYVPEGRSGNEGGGFDIWALQVSNGRVLWHEYAGDDVHVTPAAGAGLVVIGSIDEGILARDYRTGALRWSAPYQGEVWGAPMLANGVVYTGTDQQLVVHSAATGVALFETDKEAGISWSSPAVVNGRVYMGSGDGVWVFGLH